MRKGRRFLFWLIFWSRKNANFQRLFVIDLWFIAFRCLLFFLIFLTRVATYEQLNDFFNFFLSTLIWFPHLFWFICCNINYFNRQRSILSMKIFKMFSQLQDKRIIIAFNDILLVLLTNNVLEITFILLFANITSSIRFSRLWKTYFCLLLKRFCNLPLMLSQLFSLIGL